MQQQRQREERFQQHKPIQVTGKAQPRVRIRLSATELHSVLHTTNYCQESNSILYVYPRI
jgi:hypothetical protein